MFRPPSLSLLFLRVFLRPLLLPRFNSIFIEASGSTPIVDITNPRKRLSEAALRDRSSSFGAR